MKRVAIHPPFQNFVASKHTQSKQEDVYLNVINKDVGSFINNGKVDTLRGEVKAAYATCMLIKDIWKIIVDPHFHNQSAFHPNEQTFTTARTTTNLPKSTIFQNILVYLMQTDDLGQKNALWRWASLKHEIPCHQGELVLVSDRNYAI